MRLIQLRPLHDSMLGAAADIGTTTIEMYIVGLPSGEPVAYGAVRNLQGQFGSDVISRIEYAAAEVSGTSILQGIVRAQIGTLLDACLARSGGRREMLRSCVVTGNTTMLHLAAGLSPASMGHYPYSPVSLFGCEVAADTLQLPDSCELYFAPCVSAFVGADTVCGVHGLQRAGAPDAGMLVDLGTNGEIIAWKDGALVAAAAAAGPVFEGGGISCGVPAAPGAVTHVVTDEKTIMFETIDGVPPIGLCGSGLIDALACALRLGAVDASGALVMDSEFVATKDDSASFVLADDLILTQKDVRQLQTAKAAIYAGCRIVLGNMNMHAGDLRALYLAGGLGTAADPASAAAIGIVPHEPAALPAGNAALRGAVSLISDPAARKRVAALASSVQTVDLALDPSFSAEFTNSMEF